MLVSLLLLVTLVVGAPASFAVVPLNGAVPADAFAFSANYDNNFYVSSAPINVTDRIWETRNPLSVKVSGSSYVDAGVVYTPPASLTLGALRQIALAGDFVNTTGSVLNIWIDASGNGSIFEYDATGKLTSVAGDAYGCINAEPANGVLTVNDSTTFYMMTGAVSGKASPSLAELKAAYPNAKFQLWIGVNDATKSNPELTVGKLIVNPPSQVVVDRAVAGQTGVTADGLIIGVEAFATIREAIAAVAEGGTVYVAAGTYPEALTITKSLSLLGAGKSTTKVSPVGSSSGGIAVMVKGTGVEVEIANLTIDGTSLTPDSSSFLCGVVVRDGAYCHIHDNTISSIKDLGDSGMQRGLGILVGRNAWATTGTADITNNTIAAYQKCGIVIDNAGSAAHISGNTVTGAGQVAYIAQNGIQISRGATATVEGNTVSGNWYTPAGDAGAGILLYQAGETTISGNTISGNEAGIIACELASLSGIGANTYGQDLSANDTNVVAETEGWTAPAEVYVDGAYTGRKAGEVLSSDPAVVIGYNAFATVQRGIDALPATGGTVHVASGEYNENVTLPASKQGVTLAGAAGATITGAPGGSGYTLLILGPESTVQGFTIENYADTEPRNSVAVCVGYQAIDSVVEHNVITGHLTGVYLATGTDGLTLSGNEISGNANGILIEGVLSDTEISENTISDNDLTDEYWTGLSPAQPANAGIRVLQYYVGTGNTISRNIITGNGAGVGIDGSASIDAFGNYWGVASASGVGSLMFGTGNVNYDPWYTDAEMNNPASAKKVINTTQGTSYDTIQAAITAAAEGDTIVVSAGTYAENLTIAKSLTLKGAQAGLDPTTVAPTDINETIMKGTVALDAGNVTLDGLAFVDDQIGRNYIALYLKGSGDYTVRNCVFTRDTGKTSDQLGLAVEKDRMIRAIHIGPASCSATIENNLFTGSAANVYRNSSWRSAIWSDGVSAGDSVSIRNNVFNTNRTALNFDNKVDNITLTGNRFLNNATHISLGGSPALDGQWAISGNQFSLAETVFNLSGVAAGFRLDATGNTYDLTAANSTALAKAPSAMTLAERFVLESMMLHRGKSSRQGLVTVLAGEILVDGRGGTIQQALALAADGDVIQVAAGTYAEALTITKPVTVKGAGIGATVIKPSALLDTNIGHKYDADMQVAVLVDGVNGAHLQDMTIDAGSLAANAVVFWNGSTGSLDRVNVANTGRTVDGMQTGQGIAVDAGTGKTTDLDINDCQISGFNKNGIDAVNGNGVTSNGGNITVNVTGGTITGLGATDKIAQNGILFWEYAGGTVGGSIVDVTITGFSYTPVDTQASGVLLYAVTNGTVSVTETYFGSTTETCVSLGGGTTVVPVATHNYWGSEGPTGRYEGTVLPYPYYLDAEMTKLSVIIVDDGFAQLGDGTELTVNGQCATIGLNAFASLADAVKAAYDGATISVYPGNYPLTTDSSWTVTAGGAGGQGGWYLPIIQDNLTIQGVNEAGDSYAAIPTIDSELPIIYGNDFTDLTVDGSWAYQNLVTVFGNNVKLTGLALMPKTDINKTVELVGANPTVQFCRFQPNTKFKKAGYDFTTDGGCLYVNGGLVGTGLSNAELTDNYFLKSCVVFDSVTNTGTNRVARSTFDTPWSYDDNGTTVYGYMIGNTSWTTPTTTDVSDVLIEGNTFINFPTTEGYYLIKNRLDGRFTLRANRIGGKDNAELIQIATASFGCLDGTALIESWVNNGGQTVRSHILVDRFGIHRQPNNPGGGGNGNGNGGGGLALPPIIAGSTSEQITTAGGTVNHEDTVVVTFPASSVSADVTVTIAPVVENIPPTTGMIMVNGHVYDITAETADGTEVTTFTAPVTIAITLTAEDLAQITAAGGTPQLHFWDVKHSKWVALPTVLNGNVLTATTSHLTTFAVTINGQLPTLKDIKGNWAEEYILRLVGLGVAGGRPDGTFAPSSNLTRTEAAKLLANALGLQTDETYALTFADAASIPAWGKGYVAAVVKAGIMKGDNTNRFNPEGVVTRAEFAVMVARALNLTIDANAVTTFTDDAQVPGWAKGHVAAAVKAGILNGLPGNRYGADQACNREQAAKMLCKLIDLLQ